MEVKNIMINQHTESLKALVNRSLQDASSYNCCFESCWLLSVKQPYYSQRIPTEFLKAI